MAATTLTTVTTVVHHGWARKQGSKVKSWKNRYFELHGGGALIYYARPNPNAAGVSGDVKGSLKVAQVEPAVDVPHGLCVHGDDGRVLKFQVANRQEMHTWLRKLQENNSVTSASASPPVCDRANTEPQTTMTGWLLKEGRTFKTWKRRYMTLTGSRIQYHARVGGPVLGEMAMDEVKMATDREWTLNLVENNNSRVLRIAAESQATIAAWDHALSRALGAPPCFASVPPTSMSATTGVTHCGWLRKQGQHVKNWKHRYFVLDGNVLSYADNTNARPKGSGVVEAVTAHPYDHHHPFGLDLHFQSGRLLRVAGQTL